MKTLYDSIQQKVDGWIAMEKQKHQSVPGGLSRHIEKMGKLREPQKKAIDVWLWLKFVGGNRRICDIIKDGLLYDEDAERISGYPQTFARDYVAHFLYSFFEENGLRNLADKLKTDPHNKEWQRFLERLFNDLDYPDYLFSLPMGAGKTFLMAAFIYLELHLASLYKNDKRFAHNFIVLAPQALKTAILPSLQTIKHFDPEWILPKNDADKIRQVIHIEMLDALSSKRRDKLQGNNPNLEKVNRLLQTKQFGLVFITNAEKVVLERYDQKDRHLADAARRRQTNLFDPREIEALKKSNELRDRLAHIPRLGVILDEADRAFNTLQKIRETVRLLGCHGHLVGVNGFTGTPYYGQEIAVGGAGDGKIRLKQIQNVVYNYLLSDGIGVFLKIPDVRRSEAREGAIIADALKEFFEKYDIRYPDGSRSKIAFYCPSIRILNEEVLPRVLDWYARNRADKEGEVFKFYSDPGKGDERYKLPRESAAIFNNLDKPYSDKRVILLVAIGTRGWDCRSLAAVVLPRLGHTEKNFVLQTTCRCLREVADARTERALVYLHASNYKTLDEELKRNYGMQIADLNMKSEDMMPVRIRKKDIGTLAYRQVHIKYTVVSERKSDPKKSLARFGFDAIKRRYPYDAAVSTGRIGGAGMVGEARVVYIASEPERYEYDGFLYDVADALYGRISAAELHTEYEKELASVYRIIVRNGAWIAGHPRLSYAAIAAMVAGHFASEVEYKKETFTKDAKINLLSWKIESPELPMYQSGGKINLFMPHMKKEDAPWYKKYPQALEDKIAEIDPANASFNYAPYLMDSSFEQRALEQMLTMAEMAQVEVYYNGYRNGNLESFHIDTPRGGYTPDFLMVKRTGAGKKKGAIASALIVETKGKIYDDSEFRTKEQFVKGDFRKHNPQFRYVKFIDEKVGGNFTEFFEVLQKEITAL